MNRYFVTIDYDEPKQKTYRAVEICKNRDELKRFETGDFLVDWIDSLKSMEDADVVLHSSSVDHFLMDGGKYLECAVKKIDGKHEIVGFDDYLAGNYDFTAMISTRMKSFQSLQKYYKKKKKVEK